MRRYVMILIDKMIWTWARLMHRPRVVLKSNDIVDGQLVVDVDWNDKFVEVLRNSGYTGITDEQIVRKWLSMISADIAAQHQTNDSDFT